jgi:hypothetical protein
MATVVQSPRHFSPRAWQRYRTLTLLDRNNYRNCAAIIEN